MASVKFFNCMDFPVHFRRPWLAGNPAQKLDPGGIIEGPYEYLSKFTFLRPIPMSFDYVPSMTRDNKNNYSIKLDQTEEDKKEQEELRLKYAPLFKLEQENVSEVKVITESEKDEKIEESEDLRTVDWKTKSVDNIEKIASDLGIDINKYKDMTYAKRKWALIKEIKEIIK